MVSTITIHAPGMFFHEVADERGNILLPFSQGRHMYGEHPQAVVKIAAECARGDHLRQIAICGGHETNIHARRMRAAQPLELLLLQHAQKFGLQFERNISDFVQKNSAAIRQLKSADPLRDRSGKCAALVTEQFRFEQAGGNCGAIYFYEGALPARA